MLLLLSVYMSQNYSTPMLQSYSYHQKYQAMVSGHTEKRPRGPRTTHMTHCCKGVQYFKDRIFPKDLFRFTKKDPLAQGEFIIRTKQIHPLFQGTKKVLIILLLMISTPRLSALFRSPFVSVGISIVLNLRPR